jgi:hypothetical protein
MLEGGVIIIFVSYILLFLHASSYCNDMFQTGKSTENAVNAVANFFFHISGCKVLN